MKLCYVSGKYRANTIRGVLHNIRAAEEVAIELWKMGYAVICPHANTRLFDGSFDEGMLDYESAGIDSHWKGDNSIQFIKGDVEMLKRFDPGKDIVVMLPNWQESEGACIERREAEKLNIEIFEWDNELDRNLLPYNAHDPDGKFSWPEDA